MIGSLSSDRSDTRNPGYRFWMCSGEMVFFATFLAYLMIFQSRVCNFLKNHQIWQKIGKREEKHWFQLPLTHFSTNSGYPKIQIRVPDPSLKSYFSENWHQHRFLSGFPPTFEL